MLIANLFFLVMIILFAVKIRLDFENLKKKFSEQSDVCKEMKIKSISDEERISSIESDIKSLDGRISAIHQEVEKIKLYYFNQRSLKTDDYHKSSASQIMRATYSTIDGEDMKSKIRKLLQEGKTPDEVQKTLGVSYEEIKLVLNLMNKKY